MRRARVAGVWAAFTSTVICGCGASAGTSGGPCLPDGGCEAGLTCSSDVCKSNGPSGEEGEGEGTEGEGDVGEGEGDVGEGEGGAGEGEGEGEGEGDSNPNCSVVQGPVAPSDDASLLSLVGCEEIDGDLTLDSAGLTAASAQALRELQRVTGKLSIVSSQFGSLSLNALTSIDSLSIDGSGTTEISFPVLETINGGVDVHAAQGLVLDAPVAQACVARSEAFIVGFEGLDAASRLPGGAGCSGVSVSRVSWTDLTPLDGRLGSVLSVLSCASLTSLSGLESAPLTRVTIASNRSLVDVSALAAHAPLSGSTIANNANLATCDAKALLPPDIQAGVMFRFAYANADDGCIFPIAAASSNIGGCTQDVVTSGTINLQCGDDGAGGLVCPPNGFTCPVSASLLGVELDAPPASPFEGAVAGDGVTVSGQTDFSISLNEHANFTVSYAGPADFVTPRALVFSAAAEAGESLSFTVTLVPP